MRTGKSNKRIENYISHQRGSWNLMLAVGLVLVTFGLLLLASNLTAGTLPFSLRPIFILIMGGVILFVSFSLIHNSFFVFLGLFLFFTGILFTLIDFKVIVFTLRELWPIVVINVGLALFPAGLYKLKRMRTIYLFPAITLVVLGSFFSLFSLDIIRMSFRMFIVKWWPLLIILVGVSLVVIFFIQQIRRDDFPYMEDDSLVAGEDD